ncbi:MAG: hypothetical protein ACREBD_10645 [Blastocatellia bacterium]
MNKVTASPENSVPVVSAPEAITPGPFTPFPALNAAMAGGASVAQSSSQEGFCDLNPINRSGIQALIHVEKVGQTQTITGFGTGFDPYKAYVSLFYDAGSPGSGPCACVPSNPPPAALQTTCKTTTAPAVNFSQMVIGYWLPLIGSSKRELKVLKSGAEDAPAPLAFISLENIGAISVREDTKLGQPLPAAPDPTRFQLRACGKFRLDKDQVASR